DTIKRNDKQEVMDYLSKYAYGEGTVILEPKKLTWSISNTTNKKPIIYILKSSFNVKAETISLKIKNKLIRGYQTQNVIGYIPGKSKPDSFIFVTAHYDHLGRMGKETYFPGANDNASGVSMLLQLAKHYSNKENQPDYSMVFVCFAAEEAGLLGSRFFVESYAYPLKQIKFLLNMDLLGTGEKGMTIVNGTVFTDAFDSISSINESKNYLVEIKNRGKAANSDHYFFTEAGVPSFFFYTMGGITAYHDVYDIAETLPLTEYEDVFKLFVEFISTIN
ncbi:MAG: M28 family peptidase, partial [Bacteroidia bacterium]|nr:M28 family peptidase [Bacteroidia bacterium]